MIHPSELLFFGLPTLLLIAPAVAAAVYRRSWLWFLASLLLSFGIIVLPLFVFIASSALIPDAKDECLHGWLNCFIMGKLALLPPAIFATATLYAVEAFRVKNRTAKWIVAGLCSGATISIVCLVYGLIVFGNDGMGFWMLVPAYIAVWYALRTVQLVNECGSANETVWGSVLGSLPFWLGSLFWSHSTYVSLPATHQGCFVVTAASRGHKKFVGPHFAIQRKGGFVSANGQLLTLWQFEDLWSKSAPRSHRQFRSLYNRLGSVIAAQIGSPWMADATYLALKPVEVAAKVILAASKAQNTQK